MEWREYLKFILIGILSLALGGLVNQFLGITSQAGLVAALLVFIIPLTILYFLWQRFK
ncbi:MAG: hypothetical protein QXJ55_08125 [Candidatus Caldarchaeum sp.]